MPEGGLLLPAGTRLLHIGPQKTGTTGLQAAFARHRDQLGRHGVVYPGRGARPREGVWAALGLEGPHFPNPRIDRWHELVAEVEAAGEQRVCVSTEDFAKTDLAGARKVVAALGGERAHVVAACRRLDRLLPSQWQQRVKMRASDLTYADWLRIVLGDDRDDPVWQNVWVPHDVGALVERWVDALDGAADRFTLVVLDESDRMMLPRTFECLLGLPAGLLGDAPGGGNASLGIGRIDLVRRMNHAFWQRDWPEEVASTTLHTRIVDAVRNEAPWPDEPPVPALPPWAAERVAELSAERAARVRELGVRVVGDPDDLLSPEPVDASPLPETVLISTEVAARAVEVAVDGAVDALRRQAELHERQLAGLRRRLRRARNRQPASLSGRELVAELGRRLARRLNPSREARTGDPDTTG